MPKRYTADLAGMGFANLQKLGRHDRARAENDFVPHRHGARHAEIAFLSRGRQSYLLGGRRYDLRGGDMLLVRPGQFHDAGEVSQEKALLYWLVFDLPDAGEPFLTLRGAPIDRLIKAFRTVRCACAPAPAVMREHFDAIIRLLARRRKDRETFTAGVYAHALLLILEAVDAARRHSHRETRGWADRAVAYIQAHVGEPLQVARLAEIMGLSAMRFTERFEREVGVLPSHYILRAKIEKAMGEIRSHPERSVTEIAFSLGFSSSQYFATAFRRITGRTPSEIRRL